MKKIDLNLKGNIVHPKLWRKVGIFCMYTVNLGVQIRVGVNFRLSKITKFSEFLQVLQWNSSSQFNYTDYGIVVSVVTSQSLKACPWGVSKAKLVHAANKLT